MGSDLHTTVTSSHLSPCALRRPGPATWVTTPPPSGARCLCPGTLRSPMYTHTRVIEGTLRPEYFPALLQTATTAHFSGDQSQGPYKVPKAQGPLAVCSCHIGLPTIPWMHLPDPSHPPKICSDNSLTSSQPSCEVHCPHEATPCALVTPAT